jgi:hypothetical protein
MGLHASTVSIVSVRALVEHLLTNRKHLRKQKNHNQLNVAGTETAKLWMKCPAMSLDSLLRCNRHDYLSAQL